MEKAVLELIKARDYQRPDYLLLSFSPICFWDDFIGLALNEAELANEIFERLVLLRKHFFNKL